MSELLNVLGVDDRPENLLALEMTLQGLPIRFVKASSGVEALAQLQKEECALVLLDVIMPGMDGYETATLIRQNRQTENIPIIFISAFRPDHEHIFKGYSCGAVDYLTKPLNREILQHKVSIFLELFQQKRNLRNKAQQLTEACARIEKQQKALLQGEVCFRTAFEQSFQFMAILDPQGRVMALNRLAKKLCGDNADKSHGKFLWNVCWIGQDEENRKLQEAITIAASGQCVSDEAKFTDINGELHYFLRAVSPVKDDSGHIILITVQGHDVTKKVEAESEKRALEMLLRQAQKMEALGTLAGGIAHDFNNILAVIIGSANLAEKGTDADSLQHQYLKQITSAADKAKDLVKQILAFSRRTEVRRVVLQPAVILRESITLLRSSIPTTIEIVHDIDSGCGSVFIDPIQYHQILMNLCTNAFHAMEDTGGILTIRLRRNAVTADMQMPTLDAVIGEYVQLTVEDNGRGIELENLEKIFDPYFTTKESGKGTGMGLSIVHGIVKSNGGFALAESRKGVGTSLHVFLPLVHENGKIWEEPEQTIWSGNERILLVDDDIALVEMGRDMLEFMGYTVTSSSNSIEALELFRNTPDRFDLVITDQTMPGMTGTELVAEILGVRPDIPIILCTGHGPNISKKDAVNRGICELAFKPLAIDELSRIVRSTLNKAQSSEK